MSTLAQAAVDLASQLSDNAKSELNFIEQIHNLFQNNLDGISSDLTSAQSSSTTAQRSVVDQQTTRFQVLRRKQLKRLSDALSASDEHASALSDLAQAEDFCPSHSLQQLPKQKFR